MSINELASKIHELKELQALIDQATAEDDASKDTLKAYKDEWHIDELTVDIFKVKYTTVKSVRFDNTAFKRENPDAHAQYSRETVTCRLSVAEKSPYINRRPSNDIRAQDPGQSRSIYKSITRTRLCQPSEH